MPKYRIEELSFIDNMLVQPGDEIETDTVPGTHWTPLDKAATKASEAMNAEQQANADEIVKQGQVAAALQSALDAQVNNVVLGADANVAANAASGASATGNAASDLT